MTRILVARLLGEFLVIVVGVLVALAMDDWRQYREDRDIEQELLARLHSGLAEDATDLARAEREVRARMWVVDAVLAELGDQGAATNLQPERLEALQNSDGEAAWRFDPVSDPLGRPFTLWPEFDLSDDAFQEMLSTGSLRIIRDDEVRAAVLRYYRVAEDQGGNERKAGEYQDRFEAALASIGLSPGDQVTLAQLVSRARGDPTFAVETRLARNRMRAQLAYYANIQSALGELGALLGGHEAGR